MSANRKTNFTAERVANFTCRPGKQQSIYWCARTRGLGLRVTASGAKAYILESRLHGKTVRITIGSPDVWPLDGYAGRDAKGHEKAERRGARQEALRLKALIDQGIDPRQEKIEKQKQAEAATAEAKRRTLTVAGAWGRYLAERKGRWSDRHYSAHLEMASLGGEPKKKGKGLTSPGPLAFFMPQPLSALTTERITRWLETESKSRPASAALAYRLLRAFIGWANDMPEYQGLVPATALNSRRVKDAVPKLSPKNGDCLQREQLPAWFKAVRQTSNPIASAYLQGLLLTGARRRELSGLKWEDVDFQWGSMTLRDKGSTRGQEAGERQVPLTPYFAQIIAALPRNNEWVFSSTGSEDGRLSEARHAHGNALRSAGLPHISLQGLRRSFTTLSEWVNMPVGISAQIRGHKPSALAEKHYVRRPLDLLREWHTRLEAWMLQQAGIEFAPGMPALALVSSA